MTGRSGLPGHWWPAHVITPWSEVASVGAAQSSMRRQFAATVGTAGP